MANILNKLFRLALRKIPEDIGALPDAPPDPSKRNLLKGGAALGALGAIPVVKKVVPKIADEFSSQVPTGIKMGADEVANIVQKLTPGPRIATSDMFDSLDQELDFAAEIYGDSIGKKISKKELIKRDQAQLLAHYDEFGESPFTSRRAAEKLGDNPIYEVLDLDYYKAEDLTPSQQNIIKKYAGDFDEIAYGETVGDNPISYSVLESEGVVIDDIISVLKEKGVHKTQYYKNLVKAGLED
tara:strand:+ start:21 stop:743 length:723 start_codon:yes stop_codon:yes gene_type:complete